jgi:hypothetical protein
MIGTTPIPNTIFDCWLRELQGSELKVLLIIARQTIGWRDQLTKNRKQKDWLSAFQLMVKTGCSRRAISSAIDALSKRQLIIVYDKTGKVLRDAINRKGKLQLMFSLNQNTIYSSQGITGGLLVNNSQTYANDALHISKNVHALKQKLHITK